MVSHDPEVESYQNAKTPNLISKLTFLIREYGFTKINFTKDKLHTTMIQGPLDF